MLIKLKECFARANICNGSKPLLDSKIIIKCSVNPHHGITFKLLFMMILQAFSGRNYVPPALKIGKKALITFTLTINLLKLSS